MVSAETLLNLSIWTVPFTFHTDASDKHLGAVVSQKRKIFPSSQKLEQANSGTTLLLRMISLK